MGSPRSRPPRRAAFGALLLVAGFAVVGISCATRPPAEPDDICAIFEEKRAWYKDSVRAANRWGVPESVQLALIHQESSFRADARPPRRWFLWVIPGPRPSTAYGYGQALDSTWLRYQRSRGRSWADRDDYGDVVDFIGWYAAEVRARAGVGPTDAYALYLAYHEGAGGFARGTHLEKGWLLRVARKVESRAARYEAQLTRCREHLESPSWWPF